MASFLLLFLFGFVLAKAQTPPSTGQPSIYACAPTINFDVNPRIITNSQSVTIAGWVTAENVDKNCYTYYSNHYIVSVVDLTSSKEFFSIPFDITGYDNLQNFRWDLPAKQIGVGELQQTSLNKASSLSVAAQVKYKVKDPVTNADQFVAVTQSSPIPVAIDQSVGAVSPTTPTPGPSPTPVPTQPSSPNDSKAPARQDYKGGGLVNCGHSIQDPCRVQDLFYLVARVTNWLIAMIGLYAVFRFIWIGFSMVTSVGSEEAITKNKSALANVILGIVLSLMAYLFVNTAANYILRSKCRINLADPLTYLTVNNYNSADANGYCK